MIARTTFMLALAAALCGCESVKRAREAQARSPAHTNDLAAAESGAPRAALKGMGLAGYADFAMTNRPEVAQARLAVSNAAIAVESARADAWPQVKVAGGYSQATANSGGGFSWRQRRGKGTADVSADVVLVDFGRIAAREREALENLAAAERNLADAEAEVFGEVAQAYFSLRKSDALLQVAFTNEHLMAEHLKRSESLHAAGEAKKLDVLKARVDLTEAKLETISASNAVATAGAEFLRSLGLDASRSSREEAADAEENALEPGARVMEATAAGVEELLAAARTNSPALRGLKARVRAAGARVDYAVSDLLPELSLTTAASFADPAWNWSWGLRAVQTLLDGKKKQLAVDAAVLELETARSALDAAEQKLSCELAVAAAERDNARQSFAAAAVEVEQARENFETVKAQYMVGDASRLDFTDAAGALAGALGARVRAFWDGEAAEARIVRLTGSAPRLEGGDGKRKDAGK